MARLNREQAEARRKRIEELRPIFNELIPKHQMERGGKTITDNTAIASALNERGELNLSGKAWSKSDVSNFAARDLTDKGTNNIPVTDQDQPTEPEHIEIPIAELSQISNSEPPNENAATRNTPAIDLERVSLPDDLTAMLIDAHASGDLAALLEWWRSEKGASMPTTKRPRFTGKRVNSGLLLNEALKNKAFAKAKSEGMSLSQLVEQLFWRYVGEPQDLIEDE